MVQPWTCELGYGADTMFHRTYFLFIKILLIHFSAGGHHGHMTGSGFATFQTYPSAHAGAKCCVKDCSIKSRSIQGAAVISTRPRKAARLGGFFYEEAHLCFSYFVPIPLKCVNAGSIDRPRVHLRLN